MKLYLAGPSKELDRVRAACALIEAAGHDITEMWWLRIEEAKRRGWATDAEVPEKFMRESAERNFFEGLCEADHVIALCKLDGGLSSGVAYEIGVAHGQERNIWLVGDHRNHVSAFGDTVHCVTSVEDALAAIATHWSGFAGRAPAT